MFRYNPIQDYPKWNLQFNFEIDAVTILPN
jgi:hypothetical protein